MANIKVIEDAAKIMQKLAPKYNICVISAPLSQLVLESAIFTSELAVNACNYGGLKYRPGRCPTSNGIYHKIGSEQNPDGTYVSSAMQWFKFPDMESGIQGYFDFINISNYKSLKGVTDPQTYLENIKAAGYATSLNYVKNCMNVIKKYNLTQYDTIASVEDKNESTVVNNGGKKMRINVHAGHNPDGKIACGAIGLLKESTENRAVKNKVIEMLRAQGHTVFDCTEDNGTSAKDVLKKIVARCNANKVDLDVSIHFNAGSNKLLNKITTGTEVLVYSKTSDAFEYAEKIVNAIAALKFKNRGVKTSKTLYVLKKTKNPALLIECCFVDDPDDADLYNCDLMAQAIVKGITGEISPINNKPTGSTSSSANTSSGAIKYYRVQTGAYSLEKNAIALQNKLKKKGFNCIVKKIGILYKVQVGAYSKQANAEAMLQKLKSKGFNGFITYS